MADLGIHVWTGQSGQKYRYTVYMFGTGFGPGTFTSGIRMRARRCDAPSDPI